MKRKAFCTLVVALLVAASAIADPSFDVPETSNGVRRTRPAHVPYLSFAPSHNRLLWIGAHPDDEVLAAPILGWLCGESGWNCTFLIATRGERGECLLPTGCQPDLSTVRWMEAGEVARLLGAELIFREMADGPASTPPLVRAHWEENEPDLEARLAAIIEEVQPDVILTFDPRHGSTCHPDHRAIGALVIDAASSGSTPVLLLENRFQVIGNRVTVSRANVRTAGLLYFNSSRTAVSGHGTYWDYASMIATIYRSQFPPELVESLAGTPPVRQWLFVSHAGADSSFSGEGACEAEAGNGFLQK